MTKKDRDREKTLSSKVFMTFLLFYLTHTPFCLTFIFKYAIILNRSAVMFSIGKGVQNDRDCHRCRCRFFLSYNLRDSRETLQYQYKSHPTRRGLKEDCREGVDISRTAVSNGIRACANAIFFFLIRIHSLYSYHSYISILH